MPALATDAGFQGITVVHAQGGDGASVDLVLHDGAVGGGVRPQREADAGAETEASTDQGGDGASVDLVLQDGAVGGGGRPQGEADAGTETEASTNCSGPNSGAPGLVSPGP